MYDLLRLLAQNVVTLICGTSFLLLLGCGAAALSRSPVHRQRLCELTIAGVLVWLVLALFPLPRVMPDYFAAAPQVGTDIHHAFSVPEPIALDSAWPGETASPQESLLGSAPPLPVSIEPHVLAIDASEELAGRPPSQGIAAEIADGIGIPSSSSSPSEALPPPETPSHLAPAASSWLIAPGQIAGLCAGAYLAGGALSVLWILAGHLLLLRLRRSGEMPPLWLTEQFRDLAQQSKSAPPRLIVSTFCSRPLSWGVFWPVIMLPLSLCRPENKSQLRTILLHELGHIARHDARGNLLFTAALPLLYCHPLYWWLRREAQLATELVADDWAAGQTGKETYVEELVALARCTGRCDLPLVGVTGLFTSPSLFYRRMQMLLAREKPLITRTSLPWRLASCSALAIAVTLAAALAGVRPADAQTEPATPAAEPLAEKAENSAVPPPPAAKVPNPQPPDAEEAALLAEVNKLQQRLRELQTKRGVEFSKPDIVPSGKVVRLSRSDENGVVWTEIWSTDEKGQPAKIITRSAASPISKTPIVARLTPDRNVVVREYSDKDGRWLHILDAETGKIMETRRLETADNYTVLPPPTRTDPNSGQPPVTAPRLPSLTLPAPPAISFPPRTVPAPSADYGRSTTAVRTAAAPNQQSGSQQLDLVTLATSYADAVGVLEAAQAKMAELEPLEKEKLTSKQELTAARLALSSAQRKEQLLRRIAEVALTSAEKEHRVAAERNENGIGDITAVHLTESRLAILKQILSTRPATDARPDKQEKPGR